MFIFSTKPLHRSVNTLLVLICLLWCLIYIVLNFSIHNFNVLVHNIPIVQFNIPTHSKHPGFNIVES